MLDNRPTGHDTLDSYIVADPTPQDILGQRVIRQLRNAVGACRASVNQINRIVAVNGRTAVIASLSGDLTTLANLHVALKDIADTYAPDLATGDLPANNDPA